MPILVKCSIHLVICDRSMLDTETKHSEGLEDEQGEELDLISAMEDMNIRKGDEAEKDEDVEEEDTILKMSNPVFEEKRSSSKIETVVTELQVSSRYLEALALS